MQPDLRWLLYAAATLLLISGCDLNSPWGSSGTGSDYGSNSPAAVAGSGGGTGGASKPGVGGESTINGAEDSVSATPSVAARLGRHRREPDDRASPSPPVTDSRSRGSEFPAAWAIFPPVGAGRASLPARWSVRAAAASSTSLTLRRRSTAARLLLNYVYIDNANIPRAPGGTVTIALRGDREQQRRRLRPRRPARSTPSSARASETVSVNFTTDDEQCGDQPRADHEPRRVAVGLEQHGDELIVRHRQLGQRLSTDLGLRADRLRARHAHVEL